MRQIGFKMVDFDRFVKLFIHKTAIFQKFYKTFHNLKLKISLSDNLPVRKWNMTTQ